MSMMTRILILLAAVAVVLAVEHYTVQILCLERGSWKYFLIFGLGCAAICHD